MLNDTKHALDNITEGLANTLENVQKGVAHSLEALQDGLAELFGDLGKSLTDFLDRLSAGNKDKEPTNAEKVDAAAKLQTWRELETDDDKRKALGDAAEVVQGKFSASNDKAEDSPIQERELERVVVVPQYIREMPEYEDTLARQRQLVAEQQALNYEGQRNEARMESYAAQEKQLAQENRHEARQDPSTPGIESDDFAPYAEAAHEMNAKMVELGDEVEGEVVEVAIVAGKNYYVVEQDGERLAVPAGEKPEHEKGDEISVERTNKGFETSVSYGYGR